MIRALLAAFFVLSMTLAASAERRVALVLSADNYRTIRPLRNASNDGLAVKAALEALDFEVFFEADRDLRRMRRALDDFRVDARDADVALVFFAGHGVEIAGENQLLPVDADASSLEALRNSSLPLEEVRKVVAEVGKIGLIVLDACRNDPFGVSEAKGRGAVALKSGFGSAWKVKPGLGRIGRAENVLFAFSAAPGETASDGTGRNSPFTSALAKYLGTEGLEIRSVLTLVQQEVYDFSKGRQLPYVESGLPKLFFASATGKELPERERLLLAMAEITPSIRNEIERIAVDRDMPLAPLYGALISSGAATLSMDDRNRKLAEAAEAFVKVRDEMRKLASDDPRVTRLRREAEEHLSLGAFSTARARLADAANIDAVSRKALKENFVRRTLSEAATRYLSGGAAKADLRYNLAIADYETAAALFEEIDGEDILAEDRLRQIRTLESLGDIHTTVGNLAKAGQAYEERHRVSTRLAAADPGNARWQLDLSVSHINIGDVRLAQGSLNAALDTYQASLEFSARLAAADSGNVNWQRALSVSHDRIGEVQLAQGNLPAAVEAFQVSLDIRERLATANPNNANWQRDLSVSHVNVGDVQMSLGKLSAALDAFQASLEITARLAAAEPGNASRQRNLVVSYTRFGGVLLKLGILAGALDAFETSLDIMAPLVAADPGNAEWQRDLSIQYAKIGKVRMAQGNLPGSLAAFQASLEIRARLAAADPGNAQWKHDLSVGHSNVGDVLDAQGDLPGAFEAYQTSLEIYTQLAAADPNNARWQHDLMVSHVNMSQTGGDTVTHLRIALEIAEGLERTGRLKPSDRFIPGVLRTELGKRGIAAE